MKYGIKAKLVTIEPTNECDSDDYKTAVITLYDSTMPDEDKRIKRWLIDSFSICSDKIGCDFEGTEGIRIWSYAKSGYLLVTDSYGAVIGSYEE